MSFLFRPTKLRRTAYSKDIKYSVKHEEVEHKEVRCIFRVASDINGERQLCFSICPQITNVQYLNKTFPPFRVYGCFIWPDLQFH